MRLTVVEWHDEARRLRGAGLDGLAEFYAENARRVSAGEAPIWPVPPELRASTTLASRQDPGAFADDAREDECP